MYSRCQGLWGWGCIIVPTVADYFNLCNLLSAKKFVLGQHGFFLLLLFGFEFLWC